MRHRPIFIPLIASLLTVAACSLDPKNIGTPDSEGSTAGADTSTGPAPLTGGATDTSTGGATDTSTSGATDTEAPVDPVCAEPVPLWPDAHVYLPTRYPSLTDTCTLDASEAVDDGLQIVLGCPMSEMGSFELVITGGPTPTLPAIGSIIELSTTYIDGLEQRNSQVLILRGEGKLLYASVNAFYPDAAFAGQALLAPLMVDRDALCELTTTPDYETDDSPDTGLFFACMKDGRAQLQVSAVGSDDLLLLDAESGLIAAGQTTYSVDVRQIWRAEDCIFDVPEGLLTVAGFAIAAQ